MKYFWIMCIPKNILKAIHLVSVYWNVFLVSIFPGFSKRNTRFLHLWVCGLWIHSTQYISISIHCIQCPVFIHTHTGKRTTNVSQILFVPRSRENVISVFLSFLLISLTSFAYFFLDSSLFTLLCDEFDRELIAMTTEWNEKQDEK